MGLGHTSACLGLWPLPAGQRARTPFRVLENQRPLKPWVAASEKGGGAECTPSATSTSNPGTITLPRIFTLRCLLYTSPSPRD
eukprot:14551892-Alexandrium_andersonii.AAC.1